MRRHLFLLLATPLLNGCGLITFDVDRELPEQRIEGNLVTMLLDGWLENPIPMNIDLEQETAARDAGPACGARLTSLTFDITPTAEGVGDDDDFDFVDRVALFVDADGLPRRQLAVLDPVPQNASRIALQPSDLDLLPYVERGATITAEVSGSPPPDDVTFDGAYVVEVEAL